jgi:hypothetical protein
MSLTPVANTLSPAQILALLLNVDGAGSGLDADLLDGQSSAHYVDTATAQNIGGAKTFSSAVVVGADPGGADSLRVGGAARYSGVVTSYGAGGVSRSDAQFEAISPGAGGHALIAIFQQETPAVSGPFDEGAISYQLKNAAGTIVQSTSLSSMWCSSAHSSTGFTVARMNVTYDGGLSGEVQQRWYGNNGISLFATDDTSTYAPGDKIFRNYGYTYGSLGTLEAGLMRAQGTSITTGAGIGVEMGASGPDGFIQSYNRTSSAFSPLVVSGSTITLAQGDILLASASLTTGGFRVEGVSIPASATGPGLEFGYSIGGATAYFQGYNRTSSVFIPLAISATSIDLTISGTSKVTLTSAALTLADAVNFVVNATTGTKIGTANTQKIGVWNATPIVQPAAYTQTFSTAARTVNAYTSDPESSAYAGIDNLQAGTVYAQLTSLNALRVAYENLRAMTENMQEVVNALIDDHQAIGLCG